MAKDAALSGDVTLLKQAMLHDPLVGAVCDPPEVWQMADEMLVAQREWLPNYAEAAIDAAAERMKDPQVKTKAWAGAARKKVKGVDELRREGSNPMEADKGKDRAKGAKREGGRAAVPKNARRSGDKVAG